MDLHLIVIFGAVFSLVSASDVQSKPTCEEFSRNVTFKNEDSYGIWHLLYRAQPSPEQTHCVEFRATNEQELEQLKADHKEINGLKWERLEMKLDIPCSLVQSNRTRSYYLEKIMGNGSYRTLEVKSDWKTESLSPSDYHLYPMRLKILDGGYLGMMDCNEKFVFIMGREPRKPDQEMDEKLKQHIKTYWPEDF